LLFLFALAAVSYLLYYFTEVHLQILRFQASLFSFPHSPQYDRGHEPPDPFLQSVVRLSGSTHNLSNTGTHSTVMWVRDE